MGTPAIAVPTLEALLSAGYPVAAVLTQPDRPAGRGQQLVESPVKVAAKKAGLPVYQPTRLKDSPDLLETLRGLGPVAVIVVAFGQILPVAWLELASRGCLNLHFSLLPAYRGPAPVQWALIHGERRTGITLMRMERGLDTGPILVQEAVPVDDAVTAGDLLDRLAVRGSELLVEALPSWLEGKIAERPQPAEGTYAPMLGRELAVVDWRAGAKALHDRLRGQTPWPGLETRLGDQSIKLKATRWLPGAGLPGRVRAITRDGWEIETPDGILVVSAVQLPGRKVQSAWEAAQGLRALIPGVTLGGPADQKI